MRFAQLALLALALALPATSAASGRALLIGAPASPGGPSLPATVRDVEAVTELLVDTYGFPDTAVVRLTGRAASLQGVAGALSQMREAVSREEPVVVYFAGAGVLVSDANHDEPDPWDEAWALSDGLMLDDDLHLHLQDLSRRASHVTLIVDAGTEPDHGESKFVGRFAGRRISEHPDVPASSLGLGDGAPRWARTGPPNLVVLDGARLGAALENKRHGVFTHALTSILPARPTYEALSDRLHTKVAARSIQVPGLFGARDTPIFDKPDKARRGSQMTEFVIPEGGISVHFEEGVGPEALIPKRVRALTRRIGKDPDAGPRLDLRPDGDWIVRRNAASTGEAYQIVGPEGRVRNNVEGESLDEVDDALVDRLLRHGQQAALLAMDVPTGPLQVQMVPVDEDLQSPCAEGEWVQSPPNVEQVVPMCWRWQIEVALPASAEGPVEVGGVILGNDGTLLGFPFDGQPVVLRPGKSHRFPLQRPGRDPGLRSTPPLDITEHVLVYGAPKGSGVHFAELMSWSSSSRSLGGRSGGSAPAEGEWTRVHLPFRVQANRSRPTSLSRDPSERRRELTLNGFDITPYLPANPNALLYKVLQNAERLVDYERTDGLPYAQCWAHGSEAINGTSRRSEREWPGKTCWERPFDFDRDTAELSEGPGIDCSTSMWFVYTRACNGDERLPLPPRLRGESHADYQARLRAFHDEERGCMLFTDGDFRAGFATTRTLANKPHLMTAHWKSCLGEPLQTGDMLVTRNAGDTSGHTYMVIDPDRYVVFGSHGGDADWESLSAAERAQWDEFAQVDAGERDSGVEYQFLTWYNKGDLAGTSLEKWAGFATQRVRACWRHRKIIEEWETLPGSRPGTRDLSRICHLENCQ